MGFGHRVYKNYDPRARIVRQMAEETFTILGREPMIDIAIELEKVGNYLRGCFMHHQMAA